jgi:hypothetical protein
MRVMELLPSPVLSTNEASRRPEGRLYEMHSSCENVAMKPNLRVLKWLGTVPAVGVCTACDLQFKVPTTTLRRVADAQESLRKQFVEHKCPNRIAMSESKKSSMPSEST